MYLARFVRCCGHLVFLSIFATTFFGGTATDTAVALAAETDAGVGGLKCEYLADPVGIDVVRPRLSWVIESARRGERQTAFRVLVASSPERLAEDSGDLWDSGRVESNASVGVEYAGKPLTSAMRCWWKVRIWDNDVRPTAFSAPARWSMGLLDASDWRAQWIGLDATSAAETKDPLAPARWIWLDEGNPAASAPVATRYFRKTFTIAEDARIRRAIAYITADNGYTLWVNGKQAASGASFKSAAPVDLSTTLGPGENTLAVAADNQGEEANPAGLVGVVYVELADGRSIVVPTDATWKAAAGRTDAWQTAGFDDASWAAAKELGPYGMGPWGEVATNDESRVLPARMLRRDFTLEGGKIVRATAYVCGLGYYELYLNGRKVGDRVLEPALSDYTKRAYYATFDVTDMLRPGENAVGAWLGNGRYYAPRLRVPTATRTYGYPKLLMQLAIHYGDGRVEHVVSDGRWKLTVDGPIRANNDYDGETYDARREMPGWAEPGFDDAAWRPAAPVDAPGGRLAAQMIQPMRVTETIKPVKLTEPAPGTYVFDLGQNMVGWCRLKVAGARGTEVVLRHSEAIRPDGTLYMDNLRGAKVTDRFILAGEGTETYQPRFAYHGFRYVELTGYPGVPDLSAIEGRVVHTDVPDAGTFECSNELLNRIHRNVYWGLRGNYLSIPTDCPQRDERQGWQGDRAAESKGETYVFDIRGLYAKWMDDVADSQRDDGNLSDVCPPYWPLYSSNVTWPSAFTIVPETLYTQYGDRRAIETHFAAMNRWMDHLAASIGDDGTIACDNYGDWCVPPEDPKLIHSKDPARKTAKDVLATSYYYNNLRLLAKYAAMLDQPEEAEDLNARADRMRDAFNRKLFNAETDLYSNGTQTSCVLPLTFGMVPAGHREGVFDNLVDNIQNKTDGHVGTGLIGGQWLMRTLTRGGRVDVAYRLATNTTYPSWGYMLEHDATTIWELWNGNTADPAMNSHNHVMLVGDLVIWMHEDLAGIKSSTREVGFAHIIMHPHPVGDLRFVRSTHHSMYGPVTSHWRIEDGTFLWTVVVPPNTKATIHVPTADPKGVTESGKPAGAAEGVELLGAGKGLAAFRVGAGKYEFAAPSSP